MLEYVILVGVIALLCLQAFAAFGQTAKSTIDAQGLAGPAGLSRMGL